MTDCQSHHQPTRSNTVDTTTLALGLEDRHVAGTAIVTTDDKLTTPDIGSG